MKHTTETPLSDQSRESSATLNAADWTIGLSISNSPNLECRGFGTMHLHDAMVEFARFLSAGGATLAYGGDLRQNGFTRVLFELIETHRQTGGTPYARIASFLAWPIHLHLYVAFLV